MLPLTHHEIVELVQPLTRQGRQVDLGASDRLARRLMFKPHAHPQTAPDAPACAEVLQLDSLAPERVRLTRTVTWPGGLQSALQADGAALEAVWAQIEAVPVQRQWLAGPDHAIAQSHRWTTGDTGPECVFTRGVAQVGGFTITLVASPVRGYDADLGLVAAAPDTMALPEDLLGVLGWNWGRLARSGEGWACKVKVRGREPQRSRRAEAALSRAAAHLELTLAQPPRAFHQRWVWARWAFALRRAMPLLACVALVAGAAAVPKLPIAPDSVVRMMIFNAPPLLLVLCLALQELPRFEIPPLPRASVAPSWRVPARSA
jgi:hypothetical protein